MSAATAMVGLFVGLLIGGPAGFTYAVARRGWSDRGKAREMAKQYERDARDAARTTLSWVGVGILLVVITFACVVGAASRNRAGSAACAPTSRPTAAVSRPSEAGRLVAAEASPTACSR
ncbi:hypothetical protein [Rugosimonospora africana]|uniref:hypothetical protein n=1 Tax=Rugosimonospora africana TaxID=556532 RepID=UPI0019447934|nr:hypothetical protein [Rugosimonospora africana]